MGGPWFLWGAEGRERRRVGKGKEGVEGKRIKREQGWGGGGVEMGGYKEMEGARRKRGETDYITRSSSNNDIHSLIFHKRPKSMVFTAIALLMLEQLAACSHRNESCSLYVLHNIYFKVH